MLDDVETIVYCGSAREATSHRHLLLLQPIMVWHLVIHHLSQVTPVNFLTALLALIEVLPLVVGVSVCFVSSEISEYDHDD